MNYPRKQIVHRNWLIHRKDLSTETDYLKKQFIHGKLLIHRNILSTTIKKTYPQK
jgi:hypothetical protein